MRLPASHPGYDALVDDEKKWALWVEVSLLMAVLLLGTNPVAVKYAVGDISPLPFVALRFTVAGLLALGVARMLGVASRLGRRDLLSLTGVGVVGVGMNNVFFTLGVSQTTASNTALIYAAVPVWGMILGFALGLERPTRGGILGVALAFAGVGVIVYGGLGAEGTSLEGDLLVVGATVCWSSYAVFSLPLLRRHPPLTVAAYTMLFGGLAAAVPAVPFFARVGWSDVGREAWMAALYSTVLVAAFGFAAWQRGISRIGANRVLVYQYLITLTGVTASILLLGEGFGVEKILGGAVLLGGVYLARR